MEENKQIFRCDGHAHIGTEKERQVRREQNIMTMYCGGNPAEWEELYKLESQDSSLIAAYGLHPWHSARCSVEEMEPWLKRAKIIGEIGMDSVWCQVPLNVQEKAFCAQLELAAKWKKPVVLHTKGQEEKISRLIAKYPNKYLVHWYSSLDYLEKYLDLDCYFTVGPDLEQNEAVQQVVSVAPANRLITETDGWSAVCWALGERPVEEMGELLDFVCGLTARMKGISQEEMSMLMPENMKRFMAGK